MTTAQTGETPVQITREVAAKIVDLVSHGLVKGLGTQKPGMMCVEAVVCAALDLPHGDDPGCVSEPLRRLKIRLNDSNWSSNKARGDGLRRLAIAQLGTKGVIDDKEFVRRVVDRAIRKSTPDALRSAASICKHGEHKAALLAAADRCAKEGTRESAQDASQVARNAYTAAANAADAAYNAANAAAYTAANAADAAYNAANAAAYTAAYTAADAAYNAANAAAAADAAYNAADADAAADAKARDKSLADYAEDVVQILIELGAPGCEFLDLAPLKAA